MHVRFLQTFSNFCATASCTFGFGLFSIFWLCIRVVKLEKDAFYIYLDVCFFLRCSESCEFTLNSQTFPRSHNPNQWCTLDSRRHFRKHPIFHANLNVLYMTTVIQYTALRITGEESCFSCATIRVNYFDVPILLCPEAKEWGKEGLGFLCSRREGFAPADKYIWMK